MSMDLIANVLIEAGICPSLFPHFIRNYHLTATLTKDRNVFLIPYHSPPPFRRQPTRPEYRLQELVRLCAAARTGHTGYVTAPQPDSSVTGWHRWEGEYDMSVDVWERECQRYLHSKIISFALYYNDKHLTCSVRCIVHRSPGGRSAASASSQVPGRTHGRSTSPRTGYCLLPFSW